MKIELSSFITGLSSDILRGIVCAAKHELEKRGEAFPKQISIRDLYSRKEVSTKLYWILTREEIDFITDLGQYYKTDILKFRNMGKKTLNELIVVMDKYETKFLSYDSAR